MARRNVFVGVLADLEAQSPLRFAPQDRRAALLEQLRAARIPVYVEIDPETGTVSDVRIPREVKVASLTLDPDGDAEVTYEFSQARHVIRKGSEDYDAIVGALRRAYETNEWLLVTPDDAGDILDVRPHAPRGEPPPAAAGEAALRLPSFWKRFTRCISPAEAQRLFNLVAATTCDPVTVPPPCIPFLYPDDGCWGRAHEMARLMIAADAAPRKIWIYGRLRTPTRNNPHCYVPWGWHVAPTLCVKTGLLSNQEMVVDPSLFTTPVSQATWKGKQGDPAAQLVATDVTIFHRTRRGTTQTDPTYAKTNQVLSIHRAALRARSLGKNGPPPYAHCP